MWWIIGIIIVLVFFWPWLSEEFLALIAMILDIFNDWGE